MQFLGRTGWNAKSPHFCGLGEGFDFAAEVIFAFGRKIKTTLL